MLKAAVNSYLVFHEDLNVTLYIKLGTFVDLEPGKPLQALMNGFGTIDDDDENSKNQNYVQFWVLFRCTYLFENSMWFNGTKTFSNACLYIWYVFW